MKFRYLTCCVESTAEKIHAMQDAARSVNFRTLSKQCAGVREWAKQQGYSVGSERGLHLKDDWAVSFHKSTYDGQPCYYIRHSAIEYIFTEQKS